jgi:hypothetical protein
MTVAPQLWIANILKGLAVIYSRLTDFCKFEKRALERPVPTDMSQAGCSSHHFQVQIIQNQIDLVKTEFLLNQFPRILCNAPYSLHIKENSG